MYYVYLCIGRDSREEEVPTGALMGKAFSYYK